MGLFSIRSVVNRKRINKLQKFLSGINIPVAAHIRVKRLCYYHHGIYLGDNKVIHFTCASSFFGQEYSSVQIISLSDFLDSSNKLGIIKHGNSLPPDKILSVAKEYLEGDNWLRYFDSEHFANYCETGNIRSEQIECLDVCITTGTDSVNNVYPIYRVAAEESFAGVLMTERDFFLIILISNPIIGRIIGTFNTFKAIVDTIFSYNNKMKIQPYVPDGSIETIVETENLWPYDFCEKMVETSGFHITRKGLAKIAIKYDSSGLFELPDKYNPTCKKTE